jgi:hypothetical protein
LGAVAVPRVNGNYGGETNKYDAATQTAYCYRESEEGYSGVRLLSGAPSSFKSLDWGVYSPDDPTSDAATDSIRYHQTVDGGFDAEMVAGGDGSIFSLNAGSYTIAPYDSVTITYGIVYGGTLADMLAASDAMKARYSDLFTSVEVKPGEQLPMHYTLSQNWPNPFNPTTTIQFELEEKTDVQLSVFNLRGQLVNTIISGAYSAGTHIAVWNGKDASGRDAAAGIYFYHLKAEKNNLTRKMTLVR